MLEACIATFQTVLEADLPSMLIQKEGVRAPLYHDFSQFSELISGCSTLAEGTAKNNRAL